MLDSLMVECSPELQVEGIRNTPVSVTTVLMADVVLHFHVLNVHFAQNTVHRAGNGAHNLIDCIRVCFKEGFEFITPQGEYGAGTNGP